MSTSAKQLVTPQQDAWVRPLVLLALLALMHFVVDTVASTIQPLWPTLQRNMGIGSAGLLAIYCAYMLANSFSQLLFGAIADRFATRWLIWVGPLVATLTISCLGLSDNPIVVGTLLVIGGLGIASFHPEGAAFAGSLLPNSRSRAMSVFALSGYLGQAVGPSYSGLMTEHHQVQGLAYGIYWFGGALIILAIVQGIVRRPLPQSQPVKRLPKSTSKSTPFKGDRPSMKLIGLLLTIGALRILPALGTPFALSFLLDKAGESKQIIGAVQSAFMAGTGIGAMFCAAWVRREHERRVICYMPLVAAPVVWAASIMQGWGLVVVVGSAGVLLGVTMPVYISYGQQLLPNSQRVASSITMGVSWGVGAALNAAVFYCFKSLDILPHIFAVFALASVGSSLFCRWLPIVEADDVIEKARF